jgi:leucyl-tRNA synthetase
LAKAKEWIKLSNGATRELNTMPQWAGSCWYYLRFISPDEPNRFVNETAERYWMGGDEAFKPRPGGVDLYVGGTEHAVLHLLYARFWHKVLYDLDYLSTIEPFQRLVNQGMILGQDNQKMSKSRGNIVNPDEIIEEYGADSLRLYEMFMGPLEATKPWSMSGVEGVYRFLARVWRLAMREDQEGNWQIAELLAVRELTRKEQRVLHTTIKKVSADIESLSFNTAIAQMMILVNELTTAENRPIETIRILLLLLSPFAPHLTEELWLQLGVKFPEFCGLACNQSWPEWDERFLAEDEIEIVIQVNGKLRDKILIKKDVAKEELESVALALPKVRQMISDRTLRKVVIVPNRIVNVVVD